MGWPDGYVFPTSQKNKALGPRASKDSQLLVNVSALPDARSRRGVNGGGELCARPVKPFDRHRGGGHPPTPATPPCVRVRTRRFEMVTLVRILQIRETERFEIGRGKRDG